MFFKEINTLEELKKEYKKLVWKHHPDLGGNTETMQQINAEYDKKSKQIERGITENITEEIPEKYRDIINGLVNFDGIDIEICGSWVWLGGNTKIYKDKIKELGFNWARKKGMWYWRTDENKIFNRKPMKIEEIRKKHGSEKLKVERKIIAS